jgi:hypothetical protein
LRRGNNLVGLATEIKSHLGHGTENKHLWKGDGTIGGIEGGRLDVAHRVIPGIPHVGSAAVGRDAVKKTRHSRGEVGINAVVLSVHNRKLLKEVSKGETDGAKGQCLETKTSRDQRRKGGQSRRRNRRGGRSGSGRRRTRREWRTGRGDHSDEPTKSVNDALDQKHGKLAGEAEFVLGAEYCPKVNWVREPVKRSKVQSHERKRGRRGKRKRREGQWVRDRGILEEGSTLRVTEADVGRNERRPEVKQVDQPSQQHQVGHGQKKSQMSVPRDGWDAKSRVERNLGVSEREREGAASGGEPLGDPSKQRQVIGDNGVRPSGRPSRPA